MLIHAPQPEGEPTAVALQEREAHPGKALADPAADDGETRVHRLDGVGRHVLGHPEILVNAVEALADGHRQPAGNAFVEADREPLLLALRPQRVVHRVVPVAAPHRVRPQEDAPEAELFLGAAGLVHRRLHVLGRHHGGAVEALRIRRAEVRHPVVVGARDGGGERVVVVLLGVGEETAGGKEHRHVDALGVHRLELGPGVPASGVEVPELFQASEALTLRDHFVVALHRPPESGDDLAVVFQVDVDQVVRGPDRGPVAKAGFDVSPPEVRGLHHVHVAVHDPVTVYRHSRISLHQ